MACKQTDCRRRAHSRGFCTTHYRRWRSDQPMDAPIRRYDRHRGATSGRPSPTIDSAIKRKREKPFAAEYALLAELGLR